MLMSPVCQYRMKLTCLPSWLVHHHPFVALSASIFTTLAGDPFKSSTLAKASDTDDSDTTDSDGELFSR